MTRFAPRPKPPYYAAIFASQQSGSQAGYAQMAARMAELAAEMPGYIGVESARDADGFGITVSYWTDEAAMLAWKAQADHEGAQKLGKVRWYSDYVLRVSKVERHYAGPEGR